MAINKAMKLALKALSYPDIDIKKTYKLERSIQNVKSPSLFNVNYSKWNYSVLSEGRNVPVRMYIPKNITSELLLVFFHGGGWVKESIDSYNNVCKTLCKNTGCKVAAVEYSLAPENPFPSGLNDCYATIREIIRNCETLAVKPNQIVLIGDSAGGNLSAAVSLMARDKKDFLVYNQILIYPAVYNNHTELSPFKSIIENGTDYLLTSKRICDYMELYKKNDADLLNPYFAPLLADDLTNQPKTLIITAEFDPLRDEGEAYAEALRKQNNDVKVYRMEDGLHGFFSLPASFSQVKKSYQLINEFLNEVKAECLENKI